MKFTTLNRVAILTVFCLCVFSASSTWGALIMKADGSSSNVSFDAQHTLRVKTSKGEEIVKLSDILWMAGYTNIKRIRLKNKPELLIGETDEKEIMAKIGIESKDIIGLDKEESCKKECDELFRKGKLRQGMTTEQCIQNLCREAGLIFFIKDDIDVEKIGTLDIKEYSDGSILFREL